MKERPILDSAQLCLFEDAPAQVDPRDTGLVMRVRAVLGRRFENFAWWCTNGNKEMCAACLWQARGFSYDDAQAAVLLIAEGVA